MDARTIFETDLSELQLIVRVAASVLSDIIYPRYCAIMTKLRQ